MTRPPLSALAAVLVLAGGAGVARWIVATAPPPPAAPARGPQAVPVQLATATPAAAAPELRAQGLVVPVRRLALAPEVGGRLERVHPHWRSGFAVAAGEELFALDAAEAIQRRVGAQTAVEAAEVEVRRARLHVPRAQAVAALAAERLTVAEREHVRWQRLAEQGQAEASRVDAADAVRLVAALELESARAALLAAEAALPAAELALSARRNERGLAQTALERMQVAAPFGGTLTTEGPAVGALVAPGAPLGELLDLGRLRVELHLPVDDAAEVALDGAASVRLGSGAEPGRPARVIAIAPAADPLTRSVRVLVEADQSAPRPVPVGAAVEVVVALPPRTDVLLVPNAALGADEAGAFVYVLAADPPDDTDTAAADDAAAAAADGGSGLRVARRAVALGRAIGDAREVRAGLAAGERFVLAPVRLLSDGAPVSLAPPAGAAAP